jgi:hypothetical protein
MSSALPVFDEYNTNRGVDILLIGESKPPIYLHNKTIHFVAGAIVSVSEADFVYIKSESEPAAGKEAL